MDPQALVAHAAAGGRVIVDGLVAKPEYNGLAGTITSWDEEKGRAGVKLDCGEPASGLSLRPANLQPTSQRKPFILWLHGLGDSGEGWQHLPRELGLPRNVRSSFPTAPEQPVSCNGGFSMTSWMDLQSIPVSLNDVSFDLDSNSCS